jgi:hypothetical protein
MPHISRIGGYIGNKEGKRFNAKNAKDAKVFMDFGNLRGYLIKLSVFKSLPAIFRLVRSNLGEASRRNWGMAVFRSEAT